MRLKENFSALLKTFVLKMTRQNYIASLFSVKKIALSSKVSKHMGKNKNKKEKHGYFPSTPRTKG